MVEDSLHVHVFGENIQEAEHNLLITNWAGGGREHVTNLGMASPFSDGVLRTVDALGFRRAMLCQNI